MSHGTVAALLQWVLHRLAPCTRSTSTSFSDIFVSDSWNWVEQPCLLLDSSNPSKRKAWTFWQALELVNRTTWNKCCITRPVLHKKEQGCNKLTCMVGNRQLRYQVFPVASNNLLSCWQFHGLVAHTMQRLEDNNGVCNLDFMPR